MSRIKQHQTSLNHGKLSVLTLALSGALAAMAPAHAQLTTTQYWTSGDYSVDGTNSINVTAATGLSSAGTVGTLTNTGSVTGSIGIENQAFRSIAVINNSGLISGTFASDTSTIYGIDNAGTINALNNNSGGTISGMDAAINNTNLIKTLTNNSGATIGGGNTGIWNTSTISALVNSGIIFGSVVGILNTITTIGSNTITGKITSLSNSSSGIIAGRTAVDNEQGVTINSLVNNGTIVGSSEAILNQTTQNNILIGTIGTLFNSGLIEGVQYSGINNLGSIVSLTNTNTGIITGSESGISNSGQISTLTNSGTITAISSTTTAAGIGNIGIIKTLTNSGLISGSVFGIENHVQFSNTGGTITGSTDTITVLSNSSSGTISGAYAGLYNSGYINTLTNSGLISGGTVGIDNQFWGAGSGNGTFTTTIIGTISSLFNSITGTINGGVSGIKNAASIGSLSNAGTISGGTIGINNTTETALDTAYEATFETLAGTSALSHWVSGTISTLTNSGIISGGNTGIQNSGSISSLVNTGTIFSSGVGILNTITTFGSSTIIGTITSLLNSGLIAGTADGGINNYGNIGVLNNSGLITGPYAIDLRAGSSLGSFINTGIIAGGIENDSGTALTITGGSGSTYGTLTGSSAGISASDIGTIISASGLKFTGNQLLNDNVSVGTTGSTSFTNAGTLQVNNPVTITGNYTQGSGATLAIGVSSVATVSTITGGGDITDTGYGRLVVLGNATLDDSSVSIKSTGYNLASGQRYVVVAATGSLSATDVSYSATGYSATATIITDSSNSSYQDLVVTLGGAASTSASATNSNAAASLGGLFNYTGTNAALLAVYNPALALDTAAANKAGAQLSPAAVTGAATQAAGAASQAVSNVTGAHMDGFHVAQAGGSGVATGERDTDIALWGQFFDGRAAQGERDGISGYHANYNGLLLGADTAVSDTVRAGGLFSASKTSAAADGDNTGSSANVNSYGLTAYASYTAKPWYVNVQAGVARQQYSTVRNISYTGFSGVANGSFNGQQYQTSVEAGYPLNIDAWLPGATLTPIAGLSYSSLRANGYTETGGSGAALTVNANTDNSLKSELGAKLENTYDTSYGKLLPSVQLGWRHEFKDDALQTGASFAADSTGSTAFVSKSATPVANLAVLNLGVTLLKSQSLTLSAKYTLENGGGYTAQTGSVQVRYQY